ncbi:Insulin-like growth factor 1 receptor [Clonorchis sinensis]|uniref:receptor protein-tyrosine kinase n=1 Tax=Clonorchis sinensis TaxID=79923 RepID=A0A8T1M9Y4_CLOSI|nr:Insulin-like growth factor 1 receptor [Clonorchis sinensis]
MHVRPNATHELLQWFVLTGRWWRFFLLHISIWTEVCFLSVASSICSGATFQWPSPQTLLPFRHCTSIDGSLRVIYLTDACCRDENCSLPNLVEIVGALVIEHSTCKADLSGFLPHLAVVRGWFPMGKQQPSYWEEYSLVIRNTALAAIGLRQLRVLGKLQIALWDNPSLCYVNSVHWASLTLHSSEVESDRSPIDSPHSISWLGLKPFCLDVCPNRCYAKETQPSGCWSDTVCQTGCSVKCTNANLACYSANPNLCCDPECLGACTGPGPDDCVACKHVFYNGRCLPACPGEYLQIHNHRCISRADCVNFNATSEASQLMYSIKGTMCVPSCSLGYARSALGECIPCLRGECHDNDCGHVVIYKMSDLDQVRGCSSVMSLVISLEECHDTSEADFYVAFENLREIFGSLRVLRSDSLSSLNFLRHLRTIHGLPLGETTKEPRTALEIVWNRRLKHIWNVTGSLASVNRVAVPFGSLMFSLNPNLCPEAIRAFVDTYIQMDRHLTALELELIYSSNGETAVCSPQMISVYHISTQQHNMQLTIAAPTWSDPRQVLPITLHYRIARRANSLPWRELICASGWFIREPICTVIKPPKHSSGLASPIVSDSHTGDGLFYCRLDQLKAATLYEAFIEIRTILNRESASSPWFRFNTLPNTPSVPLLLSAYPTGPYTVRLSWSPPADPNGVIIAYQIWYRAMPVEISAELQRRAQTCTSEAMQIHAEDNQHVSTEREYTAYVDARSVPHLSCTSCVHRCRTANSQSEKSTPIESNSPSVQLERILFEDRLQNFLLSPRSCDSVHSRHHRDTSNVKRTDGKTPSTSITNAPVLFVKRM